MPLRCALKPYLRASVLIIEQVYRTWVIWGRDWRVVALPSVLIIVSMGKLLRVDLDISVTDTSHSVRIHRVRALPIGTGRLDCL